MLIYVIDPSNESEFVATSRTDLVTVLNNTAGMEYADKILNWFDSDHSQPFKIRNGDEVETWHVI